MASFIFIGIALQSIKSEQQPVQPVSESSLADQKSLADHQKLSTANFPRRHNGHGWPEALEANWLDQVLLPLASTQQDFKKALKF